MTENNDTKNDTQNAIQKFVCYSVLFSTNNKYGITYHRFHEWPDCR